VHRDYGAQINLPWWKKDSVVELWVREADCPATWAHCGLSEPVTKCSNGCLKIGVHERLSPRHCGWQTLWLCCTSCSIVYVYRNLSHWHRQYIESKSVSNNFCQSSPIVAVIFIDSLHRGLTPHILKWPHFLQFVLHYLPLGNRQFEFVWGGQPDFKFYYPEIGDFWHPVQWGWQLYLNLGLMQNISSWTVHR